MLRPFPPTLPRVLVIGASTGGPQALTALVPKIGGVIDRAPVLITQHMPPTFTTILAEHLAARRAPGARSAWMASTIKAGNIYLAPGGTHMTVARRDGVAVDRARRRPAGEFLQAGGRSDVRLRRCGLGRNGCSALFSPAWARTACGGAQDDRCGRRRRDRAGRGDERRVGHAGPGRACRPCSAVLPLDQIAATAHAAVRRGARRMTPQDYDYLRKLLRERSGLVLSADKQYLVESRLLPVARKVGLASLGDLVTALKAMPPTPLAVDRGRGDDDQ